jgi:maltose alpha-D-glucosyltransferase / alpha-amylase
VKLPNITESEYQSDLLDSTLVGMPSMTENDPLWYKDAIIYEVHVRAFHDSAGNGVGDFRGLTRKLGYLEDLGITVIWLLPFYPSPLKDDGYDISNYTDIHSHYGKLDDFKEFLQEAHRRGIRVITELVLNHTSDQHPWFQRARRSPPGSPERDFYVWSDTQAKYQGARIIFKDFEPSNWSWDAVAKQYYWHRFYAHQPDLNFDNPAVRSALFPILDFWMAMGVDGMRLDAIPYLFEREGTNCENLPQTHVFLKALRKHMDEKFPGRMFVAEANQWPEDAVAYFGDGDECNMTFHFPLMPRLFMALHQEDRFPIVDILEQTPAIPENCQWCLFLRNHDELTLEMVTDEERDYMYRAYAQDRNARINLGIRHRLAPLLKNDRRRIELMNALLFSMPGTPVIYYGDEIGMGDNIYLGDRNGIRTPMQWSSDRNAGFSRANSQKLYLPIVTDPEYHYEAINVEAQHDNPSSLLWWMKRLIALRKRHKVFGRGAIEFLNAHNSKVLAFLRKYGDEQLLVVANLSRFVQYAEIEMRGYSGIVPEELFGRTAFPAIGELPYLLTLSPHGFYWFSLSVPKTLAVGPDLAVSVGGGVDIPTLPGRKPLAERFERTSWDQLEPLLNNYLSRREMLPPGSAVGAARVQNAFSVIAGERTFWFLIVRIESRQGVSETIVLPLTLVSNSDSTELLIPLAGSGFARVLVPTPGLLCDALSQVDCCRTILESILSDRIELAEGFELVANRFSTAIVHNSAAERDLTLAVHRRNRNGTSVAFGETYFLRTYCRVEDGVNPDVEIGRYLTEHPSYRGAAPVLGSLELRRGSSEPATLCVLHQFVPNQGTAWQYTLDHLSGFFERVAAHSKEQPPIPPIAAPLIGDAAKVCDDHLADLIGRYGETVRLMGQRTAELHLALSENALDPAFVPEPFGKLYQRSLFQSFRNQTGRLCQRLIRERRAIRPDLLVLSDLVVARQEEILRRFQAILSPEFGGQRIRCHGDFHLGQLLHTGKDFVIVNFDGESGRTIGERRTKRSPLRDVAGMLLSFASVVQSVLHGLASSEGRSPGLIRPEDRLSLEPWASAWLNRVSREFMTAYVQTNGITDLLPSMDDGRRTLLEIFVLEKAISNVDAELTSRPEWAQISLNHLVGYLTRV